jgi:hypothetical protein
MKPEMQGVLCMIGMIVIMVVTSIFIASIAAIKP